MILAIRFFDNRRIVSNILKQAFHYLLALHLKYDTKIKPLRIASEQKNYRDYRIMMVILSGYEHTNDAQRNK